MRSRYASSRDTKWASEPITEAINDVVARLKSRSRRYFIPKLFNRWKINES